MITLERAKRLRPGEILYQNNQNNADGTPKRWVVRRKSRSQ